MDFAIPDHSENRKKLKTGQVPGICQRAEKVVKYEGGSVPMITEFLRTVSKNLEKRLIELEIRGRIKTIWCTALLKSVGIFRSVLEIWGDLLSLRLHLKKHQ